MKKVEFTIHIHGDLAVMVTDAALKNKVAISRQIELIVEQWAIDQASLEVEHTEILLPED